MDFGKLVGESFGYASEGLVGKWKKWILLLIAAILLCLPLMGYMLRVYRGDKPAPEVENWGKLFIDGIKYLIISFIYAIPLFIILFLALAPVVTSVMAAGNDPVAAQAAALGAIGSFIAGMIILFIVAIIIALFEMIGVVRFARTGSMGEAFNFSGILQTIGKIGWVSYIIALIIMIIIIGIIEVICMAIPYVGFLILFLILPYLMLFQSRYICMIYDSAGSA